MSISTHTHSIGYSTYHKLKINIERERIPPAKLNLPGDNSRNLIIYNLGADTQWGLYAVWIIADTENNSEINFAHDIYITLLMLRLLSSNAQKPQTNKNHVNPIMLVFI